MPKVLQATKENIEIVCRRLLDEGLSLNEITYPKVTSILGSKGKTDNTYFYIRQWKAQFEQDDNAVIPRNDDPLGNIMDRLKQEFSEKLESSLKAQALIFQNKIDSLEETNEILQVENQELALFKSEFSDLLRAKDEALESTKTEVKKILSEQQEIEIQLAKTSTELARSRERVEELKGEVEKGINKYISFTNSLAEAKKREMETFWAELDKEKEISHNLIARIEQLEVRNTELRISNADLTLAAEEKSSIETTLQQISQGLTSAINTASAEHANTIKLVQQGNVEQIQQLNNSIQAQLTSLLDKSNDLKEQAAEERAAIHKSISEIQNMMGMLAQSKRSDTNE